MTKLEKELLEAVEKAHFDFGDASGGNEDYFIATAAAEVCKRYIEKALDYSWSVDMSLLSKEEIELTYNEWFKENGIL
jgi:hypothetical protein